MVARLSGVVFGLWRLWIAATVALAAGASPGVMAFVYLELWMGVASIVNAARARVVDSSWLGLGVPVLYSIGLFVRPVTTPSAFGDAMLFVLCLPRLAAVLSLGIGCTCGVSTFYKLADGGVYALVRHPMQLSGLLSRVGICVAFPCIENLSGLWILGVACVCIVLLEERFLVTIGEWREYAARVQWRLLPGVW